jgi:hypothetical protein
MLNADKLSNKESKMKFFTTSDNYDFKADKKNEKRIDKKYFHTVLLKENSNMLIAILLFLL